MHVHINRLGRNRDPHYRQRELACAQPIAVRLLHGVGETSIVHRSSVHEETDPLPSTSRVIRCSGKSIQAQVSALRASLDPDRPLRGRASED